MKLQLPTVTLCIADCVNVTRAIAVVEHCKKLCDFGDVKLLTSIPNDYPHSVKIMPLNSLVAYSIFMLTKVHEYVDTPMMLIVQRDGFILNPSSWDENWLNLDFISPLFVQLDRVGSGGFSLRSKRLMEEAARKTPEWDGTQKQADVIQSQMGMYEDGVLCLSGRFSEFKFATPKESTFFAMGGNPNREYYFPKSFGFHGVINGIDHSTGIISPVCEHGGSNCECVQGHVNHLLKMAE